MINNMHFAEYQNLARRTDMGNMISQNEAIKCWMMGLAGETGELIDIIKKHYYHNRPLNPDEVEKELGDILWYLSMAANDLGFDLETIAAKNIEKLMKRYPNGFVHGGGIRE